jgi:hypothetical protein
MTKATVRWVITPLVGGLGLGFALLALSVFENSHAEYYNPDSGAVNLAYCALTLFIGSAAGIALILVSQGVFALSDWVGRRR